MNPMKSKTKKFMLMATAVFCLQSVFLHAETSEVLSIPSFHISHSIGKIEDRFEGTSERWIVQIQDIHAHFLAQENIAAMLDQLNQRYGIQTVALEGGWTETAFPKSQAVASSREKSMLGRALLEEAHIGGPVYAALFAKTPINIVGIEDPELYEQNLAIYLKHMAEREEITAQVNATDKMIENSKASIFNPDLLAFDREVHHFREGHKAEDFLPSLVQRIRTLSLSTAQSPQIELFTKIVDHERRIQKDKLQEEANRLLQLFKRTQLNFEQLLRSGKIPEEKIEFYPQTKIYYQLLKLQDQLIHDVFFKEIEVMIEQIKNKLFASEQEKALDVQSEHFQLLKAIMMFQATPEDLRHFAEQETVLAADIDQWNLREALNLGLSFYAIAKKRDDIFFEKITTDPRLQGNIVVVTGGFHTQGLSELLRKHQISFLTIRPEIGKDVADEALYFKRLSDTIPKAQTLSHEQNRYEFLDDHFPDGVQAVRESNNILKGVEIATRMDHAAAASSIKAALEEFTSSQFSIMDKAARQAFAKNLFTSAKDSKLPVSIVIKSSSLAELLKDPLGLTLWEEVIASDRFNQIVIIRDSDEILDATIGIPARIMRVDDENMTIEDVINSRLRNAKSIVVIDTEYKKGELLKEVYELPVHPVSFLLARMMAEGGIPFTLDAEFLSSFASELTEIFASESILRQAA